MPNNLYVQETFVNRSTNTRFGATEIMDSGFQPSEIGKLYRDMRREHGRCVSKVCIERKDGTSIPVGWVFVKRMQYEGWRSGDPVRFYLCEVWVHIYDGPVQTIRPASFDISKGVA